MSIPFEQVTAEIAKIQDLSADTPPRRRPSTPMQTSPSAKTGMATTPPGTPPGTPPSASRPRTAEVAARDQDFLTPAALIIYFAERLKTEPAVWISSVRDHVSRKEESFDLFSIINYPIPDADGDGNLVLRILLTHNYVVSIALEGVPREGVPKHKEMSNRCLFAGNIYLNAEGRIAILNHKSGDFRTSFSSIAYVLSVLANYPDKLADDIEIQELNSSGGRLRSYFIPKTLLSGLANPELMPKQPTTVATIIRPAPAASVRMREKRSLGPDTVSDAENGFEPPSPQKVRTMWTRGGILPMHFAMGLSEGDANVELIPMDSEMTSKASPESPRYTARRTLALALNFTPAAPHLPAGSAAPAGSLSAAQSQRPIFSMIPCASSEVAPCVATTQPLHSLYRAYSSTRVPTNMPISRKRDSSRTTNAHISI